MNNLVKYYEAETNVVYMINNQGVVSIPKVLEDNIRIFMTFKSNYEGQDKNKLMFDIQEISKKINQNNTNSIFILSFVSDEILKNESVYNYSKVLEEIKRSVNIVYNNILRRGTLKKESFVKKIELFSLDIKYNSFINWLCLQNPSKFQIFNHSQLVNNDKFKNQSNVFINNNTASIFNEPNRQSIMVAMQSNIKPISESLSIGTPKIDNTNDSSGGGPINAGGQYFGYSSDAISNQKTLVKTLPNNHGSAAFIKWYTTLFILLISLAIGIAISVVLVK